MTRSNFAWMSTMTAPGPIEADEIRMAESESATHNAPWPKLWGIVGRGCLALIVVGFASLSMFALAAGSQTMTNDSGKAADIWAPLIEKANRQGKIRVIVQLKIVSQNGAATEPKNLSNKLAIARAQDRVLSGLRTVDPSQVTRFDLFPMIMMEVDQPALIHLKSSPDVETIYEDVAVPPTAPSGLSSQ